jgi:hypothetical protein
MHALFAPDHRALADNAAFYAWRRKRILDQAREQGSHDLVLPAADTEPPSP